MGGTPPHSPPSCPARDPRTDGPAAAFSFFKHSLVGRLRAPAASALLLAALCLPAALLLPSKAQAAACAATGSAEITPADVHQARMEAKSADGAFNLSSGALDAAKACADLISRISSVAIGSHSIPGVDEIVEALAETAQDAVTDTAREACQYTASTSTAWVRSQASTLRSTANSQASNLVGARVSVTNPSVRSVLNTYRSRLRGKLPGYSDLPSLKLN